MSSLLLRIGRPDETEEMLKRHPSLKAFTDHTFVKVWFCELEIFWRHGIAGTNSAPSKRFDDAMYLASKALAFR
ncbi:hypothetical protein HYFRA_00000882 [Hymenoscyphus fraxineus]|uniref:Uncharacterized protein n=1 Tax=Hymenoscyphus fraxineus TaxID=746836 RepID=A0A9N9PGS6_9HELO|nr:hypothetical protein HYFRA_00000882 [Hymenoscyphus fraxineus]